MMQCCGGGGVRAELGVGHTPDARVRLREAFFRALCPSRAMSSSHPRRWRRDASILPGLVAVQGAAHDAGAGQGSGNGRRRPRHPRPARRSTGRMEAGWRCTGQCVLRRRCSSRRSVPEGGGASCPKGGGTANSAPTTRACKSRALNCPMSANTAGRKEPRPCNWLERRLVRDRCHLPPPPCL